MPLIDLEPWYSYVLKTERPEVVEGAPSSTPSRASTTYEPEQKVTVSLLIEISKEIMSLYGKAKKGAAPISYLLCLWLKVLQLAHAISPGLLWMVNLCTHQRGQRLPSATFMPRWHMPTYCRRAACAARTRIADFAKAERT